MGKSLVWSVVVVAALCSAETLLAKTMKSKNKKKNVPQSESEAVPVDSPSVDHDDGSSRYARSGKSGEVGLRYGNVIGGLVGGGVDGFMFHSSGVHFGGVFYSASKDLADSLKEDETTVRLTKAIAEGRLVLLQARYFFGNSFHLGGGLGQRQIKAILAAESTVTSDKVAIEVEVNSWVAQLAFGNTWYWNNGFFVGADWIGYVVPLSSSRSVSSSATGAVSASLQDIHDSGEDLGDALGKTSSAMTLVLNVGYAF